MSKYHRLGMFQSDTQVLRKAAPVQCPVSGIAADFKPFSDTYVYDPYKFFARARPKEAVFHDPKTDYWVVTCYEDIRKVF